MRVRDFVRKHFQKSPSLKKKRGLAPALATVGGSECEIFGEVDADACYSIAEARLKIDGFTNAELNKLREIAKPLARSLPGSYEAEDLFQIAIERVLSGQRSWPKSYEYDLFFLAAMASVAHNLRKKENRRKCDPIENGFEVEDQKADFAEILRTGIGWSLFSLTFRTIKAHAS